MKQTIIKIISMLMIVLGLAYGMSAVSSAIRQKVLMRNTELVAFHRIRDKVLASLNEDNFDDYPKSLEDLMLKRIISEEEFRFLVSHEAQYYVPSVKRNPNERVLICHINSQEVWVAAFRSGIVKRLSAKGE